MGTTLRGTAGLGERAGELGSHELRSSKEKFPCKSNMALDPGRGDWPSGRLGSRWLGQQAGSQVPALPPGRPPRRHHPGQTVALRSRKQLFQEERHPRCWVTVEARSLRPSCGEAVLSSSWQNQRARSRAAGPRAPGVKWSAVTAAQRDCLRAGGPGTPSSTPGPDRPQCRGMSSSSRGWGNGAHRSRWTSSCGRDGRQPQGPRARTLLVGGQRRVPTLLLHLPQDLQVALLGAPLPLLWCARRPGPLLPAWEGGAAPPGHLQQVLQTQQTGWGPGSLLWLVPQVPASLSSSTSSIPSLRSQRCSWMNTFK